MLSLDCPFDCPPVSGLSACQHSLGLSALNKLVAHITQRRYISNLLIWIVGLGTPYINKVGIVFRIGEKSGNPSAAWFSNWALCHPAITDSGFFVCGVLYVTTSFNYGGDNSGSEGFRKSIRNPDREKDFLLVKSRWILVFCSFLNIKLLRKQSFLISMVEYLKIRGQEKLFKHKVKTTTVRSRVRTRITFRDTLEVKEQFNVINKSLWLLSLSPSLSFSSLSLSFISLSLFPISLSLTLSLIYIYLDIFMS